MPRRRRLARSAPPGPAVRAHTCLPRPLVPADHLPISQGSAGRPGGLAWQAGALHERTLLQPLEAARGSWSGKLHLVACSTIYLSSSTTLERRKGRGRRRTKTGAPARTTPAVRQGKKYQQGASSSALRFVRGRVTRYCVSVRPNHSGFTAWLRRQGQRYPGAVWTKELRLEPVATVSSGHRP